MITDFNALGNDTINLADVTGITDYADLTANHITADANGDVVIFDGTDTLTLTGVTSIDIADFDFA